MVEKTFKIILKKLLIKVMAAILPLLFLLIIIIFVATISIIEGNNNSENNNPNVGTSNISSQVLAWKPQVEKYAKQFGISEYVNLILAVIQQESGGLSIDVMQSSECGYNTKYPQISNGITDPDYSIYCGVQELKEDITKSNIVNLNDINNISLALQAYNFGQGFIDFAKPKGGYSLAVALEFCKLQQQNGFVNYGDSEYVPHVLRYYIITDTNNGSVQLTKVVEIAQQELGKPYVWGADGPDNFDCSGLVFYCYKNAGFKIQRLTAQDYYNGSTKTSTPAIGDLVFFGGPSTIHHIGIYIGNNQMINAPKSNDVVKIQSYDRSDFAGFGKYNEK